MGVGEEESGGCEEGEDGGMRGGEGEECILMRREDLASVQITGGVGGNMSPVGVIREWEFR